METFNIYEAKTQLSRLVHRALSGERIIIAKAGKPMVELSPIRQSPKRVGGQWKGRVLMADDFDDPMPDFEAAFYGETSSD